MIRSILNQLFTAAPQPLPAPDVRIALAALLVRLARTDGDYAPAEIARIDRILGARFTLTPDEAGALRREGEALEGEAPDTVRFTRALKEATPLEERKELLQAMWSLALADDVRAPEEEGVIRMAASLLGVSDVDSALARKAAMAAQAARSLGG